MEYDINKIRTLCERYFEGDTSAEDEAVLKEYFSRVKDIPDDLKSVKVMFGGLAEAAAMTYAPVSQKTGKIRRLVWSTIAAAASVALCITFFNREVYGYDAEGKAITDPDVALESTKYLSYLSQLETTIDIAQMITQEMENNN